MIPPNGLINFYNDFVTIPSYTFFSTVILNEEFAPPTTTLQAIDYRLTTIANTVFTPGQIIDINGNIIFTTPSWQTPNTGYAFPTVDFKRTVTAIGKYTDSIYIRTLLQSPIGALDPDAVPRTNNEGSGDYSFIALQKATSVTIQRDPTTNAIITTLGNNSTIGTSIGPVFRLDKSTSRGDENMSEWKIFKYDPISGTSPVLATLGVDFNFVTGNAMADVIDITFLTASFNFIIQNHSAGYTFDNNPYFLFPLDNEGNDDIISHNFNLVVTSISYEVLFPQLDLQLTIPSASLISSNPITTYQNQPITVDTIVLNSTGYWKKKNPPASDVFISKTDLEWKNEMITRCNIVLEIRNKTTNALLQTKSGFGPYNVLIQDINNYNFQFKTTLK